MKDKSVLIVDDEKNILLTLSQSLEVLQWRPTPPRMERKP